MNGMNIPPTTEERDYLRNFIRDFVDDQPLVPPLSMNDLRELSDKLVREWNFDAGYKGWIMVEINNAIWRYTVASIPYDKRLLLLPKCLSHSTGCAAEVDELGLLCHRCQQCNIPTLQDRAEELGMMSIVAEGFTSVIPLVENRVVDTVIGVGCLDSLEKAFPLLINNAVPGLAIPLNSDGCKDTTVDTHYVDRVMSMQYDEKLHFIDYEKLKATLNEWFLKDNLDAILSWGEDHTSLVARDWLGGEGKRWRPYLLAATYLALTGEDEIPFRVRQTAVAIECFHKASLVHDDIQDNDTLRYGKQTVNAAHGIPIAINVGDILLGEGYRLLAQTGNIELLKVASNAHISLCKGQGMEMEWCGAPDILDMKFVLEIFSKKTVPAFSVSLIMGAICAGGNEKLHFSLRMYSLCLGYAYQLLDDLEDFETDDPLALRPSAVLAALCEQTEDEAFISQLLQCQDIKLFLKQPAHQPLLDEALATVREMADVYHRRALNALRDISNPELKRLLFRVTGRILK